MSSHLLLKKMLTAAALVSLPGIFVICMCLLACCFGCICNPARTFMQ